jgi:hypothetical protein
MDGENAAPGLLGYNHLGINAIAQRVEEKGPRTAILHFEPGQGS